MCSDETFDMYDYDGPFCCDPKYKGYHNRGGDYDGCGESDYVLKSSEVWVPIKIKGKGASSPLHIW